ncbi:MAG: hypothetical protein WAV93_03195 [Bacteroidales bacterium]
MKRVTILMFCLLLLQTGFLTAGNDKDEPLRNSVNVVSVAAAPGTEVLTAVWTEGFRQANPGTVVNMVSEDKASEADIRIITGRSPGFTDESYTWKIVVGRDVLVPVMIQGDPIQAIVSERGISPSEFAAILSSDGSLTWGKLLGTESSTPVSVLIPDNSITLDAISEFASIESGLITARRSSYSGGVPALLKGKPGSIAFCRLADITDQTGPGFIPGITIIPVDGNSNARSDYFEQFYADYNGFTRGVYIGKYPKALCNNIYAASAAAPAEGAPSDFVRYILADGQRSLAGTGFTALASGEGNIRREALATAQTVATAADAGTPALRAWLWILAVIAVVSLVAFAIYLFTRSGVKEIPAFVKPQLSAFSLTSVAAPAGILYDRSHTWTFMEKNGTVRVGIDDFLQHVTGSITRLVMKFPGEKVRKGEKVLSVIQNGKKLDIQSPVSGTIISRNERLNNDTGIINSSPFDDGWIYAIEPENWEKESRFMILAGKYVEYLKDEFARIRDFLAVMPGASDVRYAQVVLQDGGEFKEGLLEDFGPEIWEEFQNRFLDTPR